MELERDSMPLSRDLGDDAPNWLRSLPDDYKCRHLNAPFGALIAQNAANGPYYPFASSDTAAVLSKCLGLVVAGRVEICDESAFSSRSEIFATRPIRLLRPGDTFGNFTLADSLVAPLSTSRPREPWSMYAGARSVLLTKGVNISDRRHLRGDVPFTEDQQDHPDYDLIRPRIIIERELKSESSRIAFIPVSDLISVAGFETWLMREAWRQAQIYRLCVNSYNYSDLLRFRHTALRLSTRLFENDVSVKAKGSQGVLFDVFTDAVYDAINRPVRREPLFAPIDRALPEIRRTKIQSSLKKVGAKVTDFWVPDDQQNDRVEYIYPIDHHNHLINSYCARETKYESTCTSAFLKPQGGEQERKFYWMMAQRLVASEYRARPEITVISCEALGGSMLALKYAFGG